VSDRPVMAKAAQHLLRTILAVAGDLASLARSAMRSRAQLAAENLFLRKQLGLYQERRAKPRRADDATRVVLVGLSRLLASVTRHSEAWDADPLASKGSPTVLALEIPCAWSAVHSSGRAAA